jgi:hypothetical protein
MTMSPSARARLVASRKQEVAALLTPDIILGIASSSMFAACGTTNSVARGWFLVMPRFSGCCSIPIISLPRGR